MKIYFYQNEKKNTTYTHELLKYIAKKNKHIIEDSPTKADLSCVSLTSFLEIDKLRIFRKNFPKIKIVAGGHVCNNPAALLRYSNFVNLGHGFDFFKDCKNIKDIEKQDYIVTKEKRNGSFSHYIDWKLIPLIQISKKGYSILYSVGCRMKCKFCLTAAINKYQVIPDKTYIYKAKRYVKGKQLYLITNDFDGMVDIKRNVSDMRIREYLRYPEKYKEIRLLRLGVECVKEENRKMLGKDIKDEELRELFKITKLKNKRMNLFYLAGIEDTKTWESMADLLEQDYEGKPKIGLILNYLDPQILTGIENYNLENIFEVDIPHIKRILKIKSARILIFRDLKIAPYNAIISSILSRCHESQVDDILRLKNREKKGLNEFFKNAKEYGLRNLIKGKNENNMKLVV